HHQIDKAVARRAEVINGDRIRMPKAPRRLAFALKPAQPFSVAAHFWRQHLNRDAIAEQDVPRAIYRAHATPTEQSVNLILSVENAADKRVRIFFQHLAVFGTEADIVVVLAIAGGTKLHEISTVV